MNHEKIKIDLRIDKNFIDLSHQPQTLPKNRRHQLHRKSRKKIANILVVLPERPFKIAKITKISKFTKKTISEKFRLVGGPHKKLWLKTENVPKMIKMALTG